MKEKKDYKIVRSLPVARFYYSGSHTHPVRRTVLIIEVNSRVITGFELRDGSEIRNFKTAPVKSYCKNKIAKIKQCGRRLRNRVDVNLLNKTTLKRASLIDLVKRGV
jgi:hypothetical protein